MRKSALRLLLVGLGIVAQGAVAASAQHVRTVMIRNNQIIVVGVASGPLQLTRSAALKALPTWSQDGDRVAYLESSRDAPGQQQLKIVDLRGRAVFQASLAGEAQGAVAAMGRIDRIQWIAADRVAASGSVNPSTMEAVVFGLGGAPAVTEVYSDGVAPAFSPDGAHYAYVSGSPHFTPLDQRAPTLQIDDRPVVNDLDPRATLSPIAWSADSRSAAIAAAIPGARDLRVHIVTGGTARTVVVPAPAKDFEAALQWNDGALIVDQRDVADGGTIAAWRIDPARSSAAPAPLRAIAGTMRPAAPDPAADARALAFPLIQAARAQGGSQEDFWCADCAFSKLPRRTWRMTPH